VTPPAVILPLSDEEIASLRNDVDAGKRRRVVLLVDSAGLAAGKAGEVTRVGRPDVDGSDFVGVRIGGDDLFFSPAEIALPNVRRATAEGAKAPRKAAPQRTPAQRTARAAATDSGTAPDSAATTGTGATAAGAATTADAGPATRAQTPAKSSPAAAKASRPPARATAEPAATKATVRTATKAAAKAQAPKTTGRPGRKPPRMPAVAITIRSTDAGWTVEAHRGGKVAMKPAAVRAGTVQEIADALDEDPVSAIVREVLDSRRAVAEAEAEELREALARAEAVLAEYDAGH
jgi:hypothetical protein